MAKGRRSTRAEPLRTRNVGRGHVPARRALWIVIALVGVVTYWNSFNLPIVFDDRPAIQNNETIRDLSRLSTVLSPPQNTPVAGRPVVNLSLAANYAIGGLDT